MRTPPAHVARLKGPLHSLPPQDQAQLHGTVTRVFLSIEPSNLPIRRLKIKGILAAHLPATPVRSGVLAQVGPMPPRSSFDGPKAVEPGKRSTLRGGRFSHPQASRPLHPRAPAPGHLPCPAEPGATHYRPATQRHSDPSGIMSPPCESRRPAHSLQARQSALCPRHLHPHGRKNRLLLLPGWLH